MDRRDWPDLEVLGYDDDGVPIVRWRERAPRDATGTIKVETPRRARPSFADLLRQGVVVLGEDEATPEGKGQD